MRVTAVLLPPAAGQICLPGIAPAGKDGGLTDPVGGEADATRLLGRRSDDGRRLSDAGLGAPGSPRQPALVWIRSFGGLAVACEGAPDAVRPSSRQRQLLRWLVLAAWGPPLDVASVCDAMWPAVDGAAAASNFSSTVHRLRRTLGDPAAVVVAAGTLALHARRCRTDLDILHGLTHGHHHLDDPQAAARMAQALLSTCQGRNPVLLAPPDNDDMAQRIRAVGLAWRLATLHLADALAGGPHARLALRLCERLERHGLADQRILARWQNLASESRNVDGRRSHASLGR